MELVDVRSLTVSEGAVRALLELGVAEVPAGVASAVDAALAGQPVVYVDGLPPDRARAVLAVLAAEVAPEGPVQVGGLDGAGRDAVARAARVTGVALEADGDDVRLGARDGVGPVLRVVLSGDEAPTGARWAGPGQLATRAGAVGEAIAVPPESSLAQVVADVVCGAGEGASFVLARELVELSAVREALTAAGLDVVLLDGPVDADRGGPGGRRRAVAAGVRGGGADVLLGLASGARDVDGRGFARVVWCGPLIDGWRGRLGRCPRLVVLDVALDVAATVEAATAGDVTLGVGAVPSSEAGRAARRVRELATLRALPAVPDPERGALVRALLETPEGEAVLTAAVSALLRSERARRAAVASLSGGFVGRGPAEARVEAPPVVGEAAPTAVEPAAAAPESAKKKRRRRKRRKGGGRDAAGATDATASEAGAEGDELEDDPTDEGPVELELSDLDAVLEVE